MNILATCLAILCVYRGTLTDGSGTDPYASSVTRDIYFYVYDSISATTPLWQSRVYDVTIDKDGTFEAVFGNEDLDQYFLSGRARYIGIRLKSADSEIRPRREFSAVATVSRAELAESLVSGGRTGSLFASAIEAENVNASVLEVSGAVNASSEAKVKVAPFALQQGDTTRLERGKGVKVFAKNFERLDVPRGKTHRGDILCYAPAAGFAMIHQLGGGNHRDLVCPAVIQYCRKGDAIRLPTETTDYVTVDFRRFITK